MVLERPQCVPGVALETPVHELNHLLADPREKDGFSLHCVHVVENYANLALIGVLIGVGLRPVHFPWVVPRAPPLLAVALREVPADIFVRLGEQVAYEE